MRGHVRVEPVAGRYVSDSSVLGQLVGSLEVTGHRPNKLTGAIATRRTGSNAQLVARMLQVCEDACRLCAMECERHAQTMPHCRISAEECRRCEQRPDPAR